MSPLRLWSVRLLVLAAASLSAYLGWISWQGGSVAGCGPESGCHKVLQSRWAYWFGLPVSFPALLLYLGLLIASVGLAPRQPAALQRKVWSFFVPASWLILLAVLWFVSLQIFVVRAFCPYCMGAHVLGGAAAVVLLLAAPFGPGPEKARDRDRTVFIPSSLVRKLAFIGAAAFVGLMAGQTLYRPPTYQVTPIAGGATNSPQARTLGLFGGKFSLNLDEVPLMGRADAPYVILALFDYTCHHCREMHPHLVTTQALLSNDLAVVHLPMPLDEKCNPNIGPGGTPPVHLTSCAYARTGLALWRADRTRMHEFDDWVFQFQEPPPIASAEAYARRLVGSAAFDAALADPWVGQQLTNNVALYTTSKVEHNVGKMPQLMVGTNIFGGSMNSNQLLYVLRTRLGMTSAVPAAVYNPLAPTRVDRTQ